MHKNQQKPATVTYCSFISCFSHSSGLWWVSVSDKYDLRGTTCHHFIIYLTEIEPTNVSVVRPMTRQSGIWNTSFTGVILLAWWYWMCNHVCYCYSLVLAFEAPQSFLPLGGAVTNFTEHRRIMCMSHISALLSNHHQTKRNIIIKLILIIWVDSIPQCVVVSSGVKCDFVFLPVNVNIKYFYFIQNNLQTFCNADNFTFCVCVGGGSVTIGGFLPS